MKKQIFAGLKALSAMLLGCLIFIGACSIVRSADDASHVDGNGTANIMCLDTTSSDMKNVNCAAGTRSLLVDGIGAGSALTCTDIKKKSLSAGATSTTYLNPSAASKMFLFKNESDNTVCFAPSTIAITANNSLCIEAYAAVWMKDIVISKFSAINTGADAATMTVMFCR